MCYMLSTTPSGRGELLIQQGELAGRSYRFEAIVCQNPTCQCDRVTLKCFTETPEARPGVPISVCLEMELERQEIANLEELKANPTAWGLANAVAAESGKKNGISSDASTGNSNSIGPNTRTWSRSRSPFHLKFWLAPWSHISTFSRLPGGLSLLMSRKLGLSTTNTAAIRNARARKPFSRLFALPRERSGVPSGRLCRSLTDIETAKSVGSMQKRTLGIPNKVCWNR